MHKLISGFATLAEAQAFADGMMHVNDSAIEDADATPDPEDPPGSWESQYAPRNMGA